MAITLAKLNRDLRRLRQTAAHYHLTPWQAGRRFLRLYGRESYSPDEIFMLGLLDSSSIGAATVVSKERLLALQLALSPSSHRHLLDDKLAFHRHCAAHGLATPTLLATYGSIGIQGVPHLSGRQDWEEYWASCEHADVVIKPVDGVHGCGVRRLIWTGNGFCDATGEVIGLNDLRSALDAGEDHDWLIQHRLCGHQTLSALSGVDSLQTLRVVSFVTEVGEVEIMAVWLRLNTSGRVFDNFDLGRSGNVLGVIETSDGTLNAVFSMDPSGFGLARVARHPTTGRELDGFRVPQWDAIRRLVREAACAFRPLRTIGWDVAVTDTGPVLIEGNHTWDPLPGNPHMDTIYRRLQAAAVEAARPSVAAESGTESTAG